MDDETSRKWVAAGLVARRRELVRDREMARRRRGIDEKTRERAVRALDAIIAEIDTQVRDLSFAEEL